MEPLSGFLARFANLTPPNQALKKAVSRALKDVVGIDVPLSSVDISRGTAFVRCSSVVKSVIRAKRGEILAEIAHAHPKARDLVRDVR